MLFNQLYYAHIQAYLFQFSRTGPCSLPGSPCWTYLLCCSLFPGGHVTPLVGVVPPLVGCPRLVLFMLWATPSIQHTQCACVTAWFHTCAVRGVRPSDVTRRLAAVSSAFRVGELISGTWPTGEHRGFLVPKGGHFAKPSTKLNTSLKFRCQLTVYSVISLIDIIFLYPQT